MPAGSGGPGGPRSLHSVSMSRITREEVERVASLARLRLAPSETEAMQGHLEAILGYTALLDELDTEGVAPTSHVIPFATPLRNDEPSGELSAEAVVANAPAPSGTAFSVPKVLDFESEG
jgi:aspartyl-tRNA(Asn)/glutamyl-tRNA(Gln) amidotransferase subunit C